ncbi:MAG: cobalamin B12-binding domain-containing protein [Rhodobacteraceae bacterium]|nr:cobalamin B12-binding domain-containing protein [Paracoccaceae bacterium]
MTEHQTRQSYDTSRPGPEQVEALAGNVLSVLAARTPSDSAAPKGTLEDALVDRLISSVCERDDAKRDRAVAKLIKDGVAIDDLIDIYIPHAARRMGEAWCRDGMGFAEVTIGSARLQGLLRDLVRRTTPSHASDPMAPQVLMVVRDEEHHTLGAMVATQQLRRAGVGVNMSVGQTDGDVLTLIASRGFDIVMVSTSRVSTSRTERLESLGGFVESMRGRAGWAVPVVVGGAAIDEGSDIAAMTGADFATADPLEALRRCNLKIPHQGARLLATSG